jgi:hypothetical protein
MIIETLLTTLDVADRLHVAPMGVEWGEATLVIKPFVNTTTFLNLQRSGAEAVVNLTDDALLFAQAVTGHPAMGKLVCVPAGKVRGRVLEAACSWREVVVASIDATPPRARIETRVVGRGQQREFLGFNRARHAVLEAAILATRTHLLAPSLIHNEFERLTIIVDKTAGPREQEAMALLRDYVRQRQSVPEIK